MSLDVLLTLDWYDNPGFIILFIVIGVIVIGTIAYLLYRFFFRNRAPKIENRIDEEKIAEDELSRILEPIEDEKTLEAIKDYEEKQADKEKK